MRPSDLVYWKILVVAIALQVIPVYAQVDFDESGVENFIPPVEMLAPPDGISEIQPKKEKSVTKLERKRRKHAVFLERSSDTVRGTSSNRKVMFSAADVSGETHVSFILNGKEFRYVYGALDFKEGKRELISVELIPDSPDHNTKNKRDQYLLGLLSLELRRDLRRFDPLEFGILSSLNSLTGWIPQDEPFGKINLHEVDQDGEEEGAEVGATEQSYRKGGKENNIRKHSADEIVSLCGERGNSRSVTFDDKKGKVYRRKVIVGDPASECLGRCGAGCVQNGQPFKMRQYTDACLVHDVCAGNLGRNRGPCSDEMDHAEDDYHLAANCAFNVVGKWRITYDWDCDGAPLVTTVKYYPDHRFLVLSDAPGVGGRWELDNNKVIRTYDAGRAAGIKYTGTIRDSNMKTKGTMSTPSGRVGCFTDVYLTTHPG